MKKESGLVTLNHGNGGIYMHHLINDLFLRYFSGDDNRKTSDSAILPVEGGYIAFTTDSFVVNPLFFPGGDIGSLSVCGTLNDLAVSGAAPGYLSAGFILEEGLKLADLERIVRSMAREASAAGVRIVTGDTKVVNAGKCDKMFINTSGIGVIAEKHRGLGGGTAIRAGDAILLNGPPGEHGMAILQARNVFDFRTKIRSDCANLYPMIRTVLSVSDHVHFMRDATRGGVATVLHEIAGLANAGIEIDEKSVPVNDEVHVLCELIGFDPLYIANEGKAVIVAASADAEKILHAMKRTRTGRDAAIIGFITDAHPGRVVEKTQSGGKRILDVLTGDQLPRIC